MKHRLTALAVLALLGGLLGAETVFTVDTAVETALAHNVSAERSRIAFEALERKSSTAWNVVIPSVQASAGLNRATVSEMKTYYGSLSATLAVSPAVIKMIDKAHLDFESGAISRETALRTVELAVRKTFYSLMYERENLVLLEGSVKTAERQYEQTLAKYKSGLVPEVDLLSAQVSLENLRPSLEAARTQLLNDEASFKRLIGIDQSEVISLEGTLESALPSDAVDISGVSSASAGVAALEKKLEVARAQKSIARGSAWLPTLSLSYVYKPTKVDVNGAEWEDSGYVSAAVGIALDGFLPFSSTANDIRDAEANVEDIALQLADERVSDRLERDSLLRTIGQLNASLKARALSLALAERNYALSEEAYRRGTKDLLSLQDASDSLQEAKLAYMKESHSLVSTVLDLEYAIGVPLGTLGRKE